MLMKTGNIQTLNDSLYFLKEFTCRLGLARAKKPVNKCLGG